MNLFWVVALRDILKTFTGIQTKKELKKWIGCFIYVNNFYDHPPACHRSNPACFYQLCFHERLMNLGSRCRYLLAFDHHFLALSLRTHFFKETPCILSFFTCVHALGFLGRNCGLLCYVAGQKMEACVLIRTLPELLMSLTLPCCFTALACIWS